MSNNPVVHIIGGGLAGCEAAFQSARLGVPIVLHEMRPVRGTEAHLTDGLAELVCSNSFRSDDYEYNAVGLLHEEMRRCGSLILACGDANKVPAGGALAVDRGAFSDAVTAAIEAEPLITVERSEIDGLPPEDWKNVIVATGPLTSPAISQAILDVTGEESLAFFDAIAPIVHKDSIDLSQAWFQSRYDKGDGKDYINCPMDRAQYEHFIQALIDGDKTKFKEWETSTPYFEGCLPIEVMAERGPETLRYGPIETGRSHQSSYRRQSVCGRATPPGQCARHAIQSRRFSDQIEAWRTDTNFPNDPGSTDGRVRTPRRNPSKHIPKQPASLG